MNPLFNYIPPNYTGYIEVKNRKEYWLNGDLHREDGPARIWDDGTEGWYILGEHLTAKEIGIAKKILSGKMFKKLPLFINHPRLKYFCKKALQLQAK